MIVTTALSLKKLNKCEGVVRVPSRRSSETARKPTPIDSVGVSPPTGRKERKKELCANAKCNRLVDVTAKAICEHLVLVPELISFDYIVTCSPCSYFSIFLCFLQK